MGQTIKFALFYVINLCLNSQIIMKKLMKFLSNPWIKIPLALTFLIGFIYLKLVQPLL
jgi:hypothetical protein